MSAAEPEAASGDSDSTLPKYSWEEVAKHNSAESLWIVVSNKVYDISKFMEEHPGGEEVLLEVAGRNATESFEDVGHSPDAREMQAKYLIGTVSVRTSKNVATKLSPTAPDVSSTNYGGVVAVALVVAIAIALYFMFK